MNFKDSLNYLIKHARYSRSETGISESTLEDASLVVEQFVKYLPEGFTSDQLPNMRHIEQYTDFCDDKEKMIDFDDLTKEEFLNSYSYITEKEYNLTRIKQNKTQ